MMKFSDFLPTAQGAGGLTLLGVLPDTPDNTGAVAQAIVALFTVVLQIITLFKKKKA